MRRQAFPYGVWLVELATLSGANDLTVAIVDGLGFTFADTDSLEPQLIDALRRKELLLVLDNFEHLIAPSSLSLLSRILKQAPGVKLLVTSRNAWIWQPSGCAMSLDCPIPSAGQTRHPIPLSSSLSAVRRVHPEFNLSPANISAVTRACHMVEGLPLAIELAAAWTRSYRPTRLPHKWRAVWRF